jgi:hypothetical protein
VSYKRPHQVKILSCNCGSTKVELHHRDGIYWIRCAGCLIEQDGCKSKRHALRLWNKTVPRVPVDYNWSKIYDEIAAHVIQEQPETLPRKLTRLIRENPKAEIIIVADRLIGKFGHIKNVQWDDEEIIVITIGTP